MGHFRSSSYTNNEYFDGRHRFEHWYRDNSLYFITSKCRAGLNAFVGDEAKQVFFDRFCHWAGVYGFVPCITSLLDNHYHFAGYLKVGANLGPFMQRFHGSVAKLVNDLIPERHLPFWRTEGNHDYFHGCLRDVLQATRAYRYTLLQAVRAGIVRDWRDNPYTRVDVECDRMIARGLQLNVFLEEIPYARHEDSETRRKQHGR